LTFAEHYRRASTLAHSLQSRFGIVKGDRVAIAMRNYPEWSLAFWAATSIGAIAVPLNAWWTGEELRYGLADSSSRIVFVDEERADRIDEHRQNLPLEAVVAARMKRPLRPGETSLATLLEEAAAGAAPGPVSVDPDDDATRNICSNLMTLDFLRARGELRTGIKAPEGLQLASLLSVPFFHVTGCHSTLVPAAANGYKLVLTYKFDAEEALDLIEREQITSFGGVPTLVWKILESDSLPHRDLSGVLRVGYGGAPAAPELVRRIKEVFPQASPSNGYGLTETSSVATSNGGEDYVARPESVGPPAPVCEVKVVGPDGETLPQGEVGELLIRGPNVIKGYWGKPEATAEAITKDGWLRSGDLARLDADGFVYLVDRAKDVVIRGGENVYCVEVEAALFSHPEVVDAAVFGAPHRVLGEEVVAVVRTRRGSNVAAEELREHVARHLAAFKVPARVLFRHEDFPRNANGKTMKREMRQEMLAASTSTPS
jgi:long-chain acyl-CoA synthetase